MHDSRQRHIEALTEETVNALARLRHGVRSLAALKRGEIIPHFSEVRDAEEAKARKILGTMLKKEVA
jgi:hypothetical protein